MQQLPTIEALDVPTRSKLRSSQILTRMADVVAELLQNALDAGARHVDVGVDGAEWTCWVRDDGHGIAREGLDVLARGEEGGRYATSKAYVPASLDTLSTFGFRGEALASAAELGCLEISSRTARSRESWSIILKGGKQLYAGPSIRWRRETPGTVVCVRDAFYNLPVRRRSHPSPAKTLEAVRAGLEAYALVFPHVSFSLEDGAAGAVGDGRHRRGCVFRVPKTASSLAAFRHLYGKALAQHVEEIDVSSGEMRMEGFISLDGAHSKAYQFFYVNKHPISNSDLQRAIDTKFSGSTFMKHSYDESGETTIRSSVRRSPRKTERKPVYVLNLTIPPRHVDNCLEPAKAAVHLQNQDEASAFVSTVVQSFLVRNGFVSTPADRSRTKSDGSPSPRKRKKMRGEEDLCLRRSVSLGPQPDDAGQSGTDTDRIPAPALYIRAGEDEDAGQIAWIDPNSGGTFMIDRRTGNSYRRDANPASGSSCERALGGYSARRTLADPRWFQRDDADAEERPEMPHWIQAALQANQAYALAEPRIPLLESSTDFAKTVLPGAPTMAQCKHAHHLSGSGCADGRCSKQKLAALTRRLRKTDLLQAEVISQVDRKFIACLIDDSSLAETGGEGEAGRSGKALVLIDQHAADERVRVERFLRELCTGFLRAEGGASSVKVKELIPPVPVLLTRHEASKVANSKAVREAFEAWGFRFAPLPERAADVEEENADAADDSYVQVSFTAVPDVVSEKLLMGDELRELAKGFIAALDEGSLGFGAATERPLVEADDFDWFKALRCCPRELLELVNSKACRGAIMFNDPLTLAQCQQLIQKLSETALPFQCAHGRPSLVPLVRIEDFGRGRREAQTSGLDWKRLETRHSCAAS